MLILTKIADLQAVLTDIRSAGRTIGFVPTMGALHAGHLSLIKAAAGRCDVTVCSIFVNPTQFNDPEDLKKYPRMPEKDSRLLEDSGCDILFLPSEEEIYPSTLTKSYDFGALDKILEGASRPGHFNGVAQVVQRLFEIVNPHSAFFGSKDYQQVMIVKALVKKMNSAIKIVSCPIKRESDGLAMSSRNTLLSQAERAAAGKIPALLKQATEIAANNGIPAAKLFIKEKIENEPLLRLDYFEISDSETLETLSEIKPGRSIALIAVYAGKIRLIDNLFAGSEPGQA